MKTEYTIDSNGIERWRRGDKLHRFGGPAVKSPCGQMEYYWEGMLHRMSGPALVGGPGQPDEWYIRGLWMSQTEAAEWREMSPRDRKRFLNRMFPHGAADESQARFPCM